MDIAKNIETIQAHMQEHHIDGWLLYDYEKRNPFAIQFMKIPHEVMLTRSLFYWIPARGTPTALVHAVEQEVVAHLPGEKKTYSGRHTLLSLLKKELTHAQTIAMEYSPYGAIPNVSMVDGGIIEMIRSFGKEVISSANFLQEVSCVLSEGQIHSHKFAAKVIRSALDQSWEYIRSKKKGITEYEIRQKIIQIFDENQCVFEGKPIVAFGKNAANPHYEVKKENTQTVVEGDVVLIDLWCKQQAKDAVYADVTEVGVFGKQPTTRQQEVFNAVYRAQQEAVDLLMNRYEHDEIVKGFELDEVARTSIDEAGFSQYFTHRLGHNIYTADHGPGANLDSFESLDERHLIRGSCFSIEPGIYLPNEFGIRLELDIYIPQKGEPIITTSRQKEFVLL